MMEFFRNGGWSMWLLLVTAVASGAYAAAAAPSRRSAVLGGAVILLLIEGMFGLSLGMIAVSHGVEHFPDKAAAIAVGLGELANNGIFAAGLALVLGAAALATRRPSSPAG
jgi:CHASE2 domain-containing sensor protein